MPRYQLNKLLLTLASCLATELSLAQPAAVAPLAPRPVLAQPAATDLGVPVSAKWGTGTQPTAEQPLDTSSVQYAQQPRIYQPVYLLNSRIIVNDLVVIKPMDIAKIDVYKADAPAQWRSLVEHGIVSITLKAGVKPKFKTKSLAAIRRQAKASGLVSFQLNGMRVEDEQLRVATDAIAGLDVLRADFETVINIRLAPPKPTPPGKYPPGTILIRGVAGR